MATAQIPPDVAAEVRALNRLDYGSSRTERAHALVERLRAEGDTAPGLPLALCEYAEACSGGEEEERAVLPFTQLIRLWDAHPELFESRARRGFFFLFKWLTDDIAEFPNITKAQLDQLLNDMESRYAAAGIGLDAVRMQQFWMSRLTGAADVEQRYQAWLRTPRDEFSDCEACVPNHRAVYLNESGRTEQAVRILEESLTHNPSCMHEPERTYMVLRDAYLRLGRLEDSARFYRLEKAADPGADEDRVLYLARTRNVAESIEALVAYDTTLGKRRTPWDQWDDMLTIGTTARILSVLGHGALTVSLAHSPAATIDELAAWAIDRASDLSDQFDARNGTDRFRQLMNNALRIEPLEHQLDLSSPLVANLRGRTRLPDVEPTADAIAAERAEGLMIAAQATDSIESRCELAAEAARLWADIGDIDRALEASLMAADASIGAAPEAAPTAALRAASLATASTASRGEQARIIVALAPRFASASGPEGSGAVVALAHRVLSATDGELEPLREASLRDTFARAQATEGTLEQAITNARCAAELFATHGALLDAAYSFQLLGRIARAQGDDEMARWADESAEEARTLDEASRK